MSLPSRFHVRALLTGAALMLTPWGAGCTPGNGTGEVRGELTMLDCQGNHDSVRCPSGTADICVSPDGGSDPYAQLRCLVDETRCTQFELDLAPKFFAGELIEDISTTGRQYNILRIFIQRLGRRPEFDDVLYFEVVDQFQVARCVRGRVDSTGAPDWDTAGCTHGPNGEAIVKVGPGNYVTSALKLVNSCGALNINATPSVASRYVGNTTWSMGANDSWLIFSSFGSAAQPDRAPAERDPVPVDFRLLYGDHLDGADFKLQVEDQRVVEAQLLGDQLVGPVPASRISGTITGQFHFDLQRSASGQAFP